MPVAAIVENVADFSHCILGLDGRSGGAVVRGIARYKYGSGDRGISVPEDVRSRTYKSPHLGRVSLFAEETETQFGNGRNMRVMK